MKFVCISTLVAILAATTIARPVANDAAALQRRDTFTTNGQITGNGNNGNDVGNIQNSGNKGSNGGGANTFTTNGRITGSGNNNNGVGNIQNSGNRPPKRDTFTTNGQ